MPFAEWITPTPFAAAGRETNIWYGTINTAILLTSSLTMAIASQAAAAGRDFAVW